jgi:hypothetical protein
MRRARERSGVISWARLRRASDAGARTDSAPRRGAASPDSVPDAPAGSSAAVGASSVPEADPSLDSAVYSCSCGYVFEAQVSTSVDCPHCGASQAW